ncbi:hypothetical protein EV356DRAFT_528095 [Viridothelium virens]|uniref:Uncharacterized protein n=1 Tax=Viridothelium virens TaxID=1048519 RepID=A0A6A6HN26_VIRVR|nr:hypothetical protein EV356DRAFT_528095 [Viridothelium virens]
MAAPSADTPGSNTESNTPKVSAPKDKACPYCGIHFTSSSLGRHLDLYIKEKNPKPPDGVHNVEEIRKLRGGITRRQARGSTARREGSTPGSAAKMPLYDYTSQMSAYDASMHTPEGRGPIKINEASWQVTGVINGLPSRGNVASPGLAREASMGRHQQLKADYEQRQRSIEEKEQARAAELALQEVLSSIKAATSVRPETKPLFDFNPYSMSFPALCLRILPAPPTLFSATPFAHTESWTVHPPGQEQFDSLIQAIHDNIRQKRGPPSVLPNECNLQQILDTDPEARKTLEHVRNAYNHWKSLSQHQHSEAWSLETLRAYSRIRDTATETAAALDDARVEIEHLRAENDKLSRCQQPREFTLHPPTLLPLPADTAHALFSSSANPSRATRDSAAALWDYDRLMEKWRRIVRESRRGLEAQRGLADSPTLQQQLQQPSTPFGASQPQPQPQTPGAQQGQPHAQPHGMLSGQGQAQAQGLSYLRPSVHAHPNGTGANGTSHASTPNALATSPRTTLLDGSVDEAGQGDTSMVDGVDEEEDRDADGEVDVDIE